MQKSFGRQMRPLFILLWLWFLWENPLFNFTGGQSVCCITRDEVVVAALAPPDLRRKHQQGERRYMVEKTVICWKSRKSFCTVVDDDDDMLSVPPEPLWVSPYFYYTAAAATTTAAALTPATKAAIVATPAVDSLIYSRVRHNKSSLLSPLSLLLLSQLLSLESAHINFRNKHRNDNFSIWKASKKSLF